MNRRALMATALWLCACGGADPTPEERLMAPWVERLDRDGDGLVSGHEYGNVGWSAPPFGEADVDGDGTLATHELAKLLREQDPADFDRNQGRPPLRRARRKDTSGERLRGTQRGRYLLAFLDDELAHAGGTPPQPDAALRQRVVDGSDLDTAEAREIMAAYRTAWEAAGLTFPRGMVQDLGAQPEPRSEP